MSYEYSQVLSQFQDDVVAAVADAYRQEGYVDDEGEPSDEPMKKATFDIVKSHSVVKSKAERSKKALTSGELYSLVFPSGPGAGEESPDLDPVEEKVLHKLSTTVWGLTQTKRTGFLQRQFDVEESSLILCRCRVYRKADPKQAIYATDNEALIKEDAVDKEIQSLVRRASSLRRDLNMIIERHPKLRGAVMTQLGHELRRIDAELTVGSSAANGSGKQLATPTAP